MIRRDFMKQSAMAGAGLALSSYAGSPLIYGAPSNKIRMALVGTKNRGTQVGTLFAKSPDVEIGVICEIDSQIASKTVDEIFKITGKRPKVEKDIRKVVTMKDIDAIMVATPDHWHAPMAILAAENKKHVYLEKPCSHNPAEGELLIKAARKYNVLIQMGNQRRSFPGVNQMIKEIKEGIIGNAYFAKTWYASKRGPLYLKDAAIPAHIDWELWQGPAPRKVYKEGYVHYNWHWFWCYGTGEAPNNGTHELDVARWALGIDYPTKVISAGGRFHYKDDWETPDTQTITLEYGNKASIMWEGRSCNPYNYLDAGRGCIIFGDKGTVEYPGGDGYKIFDLDKKLLKEVKDGEALDLTNTTSATAGWDFYHTQNFVQAVQGKAKLTSEIEEGHKSTLMAHLGNIALRSGLVLNCDPSNGKPKEKEALKFWDREYEKGWEIKV